MDAWLDFVGRTHPLFVHLPIGIIFLLAAFEIWSLIERLPDTSGRSSRNGPPRSFVLACFALTSVLSAIVGWILARDGGYGEDLLFNHRWTGVGVGVLAVWLWVIRDKQRVYAVSLAVTVLLVGVTGHFGGSMTHGKGYLQNALRAALFPDSNETAQARAEFLIYDKLIHPILEDKCTSCHGEEKDKGGLRLDSFESVMKGGDSGPSVVAGDMDASLLLERLWLPLDDDDRMPPEGKPQLTEEELRLLEWWVEAGASATATLEEVSLPGEIESAVLIRMGLAPAQSGRD